MAKGKREKIKKAPAGLKVRVRKHLYALGFNSTQQYLHWCIDNGFKATLDKETSELIAEKSAIDKVNRIRHLNANIDRNPQKFIKMACEGKIRAEDITRPFWRNFCQSILSSKPLTEARKSLCELLLLVNEKADFLTDSIQFGNRTYLYVDALVQLNNRRGQWLRPLKEWNKSSHNKHRQFSSLARHLLAKYSVPVFMDSAWFRRDKSSYQMCDWFIHIGSGKNIRTAKLPIRLTKSEAHHFLNAPDDYGIENAFRWGQIHSLGGDSRLTQAVIATPIGDSFKNDDFWISVIRFFVNHPFLDRRHVGPIIDFLNYQKFEIQELLIGPGIVERRQPPHPGLTMARRSPERLLSQVEQWHRELGRSQPTKKLYFKRSGIGDFEVKKGKDENLRIWKISEILSGSALVEEGKLMRHCVATYGPSCARGKCSIWKMEVQAPKHKEKCQTIEVSREGVIVESRGKYNRYPNPKEVEILKQWAANEGLIIGPFIRSIV